MLRRVRLLLVVRTVAAQLLAPGEPVPGTRGQDSAAVLPVHAQQPQPVPVPEPQGPRFGGRVQRDPVHAHVLHHARVPGGRRPAVAQGDRAPDTAPVRRQRDHHRLGTRLRGAVHAGRGQHTHGGQGDGPTDKRVASEHRYYNIITYIYIYIIYYQWRIYSNFFTGGGRLKNSRVNKYIYIN